MRARDSVATVHHIKLLFSLLAIYVVKTLSLSPSMYNNNMSTTTITTTSQPAAFTAIPVVNAPTINCSFCWI